jgi:uncharacterized protein with GYD domain
MNRDRLGYGGKRTGFHRSPSRSIWHSLRLVVRIDMATYIILSHLAPGAIKDPKDLKDLAEKVEKEIKQECPGVKWKDSFATMGRFDVVDIVEAVDPIQVERAAMIIRAKANCSTETLLATPWAEFLAVL